MILLVLQILCLFAVGGASESASNLVYGGQKSDGPFASLVIFTKLGFNPAKNDYLCGGSVLSKNFVLTSARCAMLMATNYTKVTIHGGVSHLHQLAGEGIQSSDLQFLTIHPLYNAATLSNDIAVISLKTSFNFTRTVQPSKIYSIDTFATSPAEQNVFIVGFGDSSNKNSSTANFDLHYAVTQLSDRVACRDEWNDQSRPITNSQICSSTNGHGISQGDIGSPIVYSKSQNLQSDDVRQIGVASFAGNENKPDVSTRIAPYCAWIAESTFGTYFCSV